jgi:hypothetical protein
MARTSTKSIINVLGTVNYEGDEITNIFNTVPLSYDIQSDIKHYDEYIIEESDRWDTISQKFYETPFLHCVILSYNNIIDPFTELVPGNKIRIIKPELIPNLLIRLRGF